MVARAVDSRRHAAVVYMSPDGRQWVDRADYESLMKKATLTSGECRALGFMCNVVKGVLDRADGLTADEVAFIRGYFDTVTAVVHRLAE